MSEMPHRKVEIIPAIIPKSFDDLHAQLERVRDGVRAVQVDIVDGVYAHHKTWPYRDPHTFEAVVAEESGLPFWEEFDFEFDLMIENPDEKIMEFVHAGATRLIVHAASEGSLHALQALVDLREETGSFPLKAGVAIMNDAQPDILEPFEAQFDFVQVMGIKHIGGQGEPFEMHTLALVERLRHRYPELTIQVDGGVKLENVASLVHAGANRLIAGSAIFGTDNPLQAIQDLQNAANN